MLQGFRNFIARGNVIDLAVGVIIGAAFGSIVESLVRDMITPMIGLIGGGPDFSEIRPYGIRIGSFADSVIAFLLKAAALYFFIVVPFNRFAGQARGQAGAAAAGPYPHRRAPRRDSRHPEDAAPLSPGGALSARAARRPRGRARRGGRVAGGGREEARVFYLRGLPFLHFHTVEGGRRQADVKGRMGWVPLDLPRPSPPPAQAPCFASSAGGIASALPPRERQPARCANRRGAILTPPMASRSPSSSTT